MVTQFLMHKYTQHKLIRTSERQIHHLMQNMLYFKSLKQKSKEMFHFRYSNKKRITTQAAQTDSRVKGFHIINREQFMLSSILQHIQPTVIKTKENLYARNEREFSRELSKHKC